MTLTKQDILQIQNLIAPLINKSAWGVSLGIGSFVTMEFGNPKEPKDSKKERYFGEWHLWIQYCNWVLLRDGIEIVDSEDKRQSIRQKLTLLEGAVFRSLQISSNQRTMEFNFDNDLVLKLSEYDEQDEQDNLDMWWFFTTNDHVLHVNMAGWSDVHKTASS